MRVWIDLSNSPHPLLFAPIAAELEARGDEVLVTARDHAQTAQLAAQLLPGARLVGGESPSSRAGKAQALLARIRALRSWAKRAEPDVALSHNSYAQIVAARSLGIPVVTAMDFEFQPANHLAFRLASIVLLPEAIPEKVVRRQGARSKKTRRYRGLKESVYLGQFEPDPDALIAVDAKREPGQRLVVTRTPPSRALYHRFGNQLFLECLEVIERQPDVIGIVLPRYKEQRPILGTIGSGRLVVPPRAVDARSLLYEADLFLGAGGTMTREAALMGIPSCSVFAGRPPAADDWLERRGLLKRITTADQLARIEPRPQAPRRPEELRADSRAILEHFVEATGATAGR